jgi:hypothetical protein
VRIAFMVAVRGADVPVTSRAVAAALVSYMDRTGRAWPSIASLMAGSGCSERTVRRSLRVLESVGVLVTERHHGRPSTYTATPATAMAGHPGHRWPDTPASGDTNPGQGPHQPRPPVAPELRAERLRSTARGRARAKDTANMTDDEFRAWADRGRDVR